MEPRGPGTSLGFYISVPGSGEKGKGRRASGLFLKQRNQGFLSSVPSEDERLSY